MSRFYSVEMAEAVSKYEQVEVKKSLFGLFSHAFYRPTQSRIDSVDMFFKRESKEDLELLLSVSASNVCEQLAHMKLCQVPNGNLRLEVCLSRDHKFVALQLSQFQNLLYRPLSEVIYFEGEIVENIATLLK